ncbi:hypothetical protein SAMN03080601_00646 [Alkalitalea saponilacus]|uniref:Uncharacterized protein n=1 Tax=Alkalitalea saponilacus TaxID=889453 RepID=A0A1T5BWK0_9BACT|nr:hypothetical protein SAMN03080601_00646 [Alkalitalea saponilacus]
MELFIQPTIMMTIIRILFKDQLNHELYKNNQVANFESVPLVYFPL